MPKPRLTIFAFSRQEILLIRSALEYFVSQQEPQQGQQTKLRKRVEKVTEYLSRGGLRVFLGVVTDTDGDPAWNLTTSLVSMQKWADFISVVSYGPAQLYEVFCGKRRIVRAYPLSYVVNQREARKHRLF